MPKRLPILSATLLVVAALALGAPDRLVAQTPPSGAYLETFDQFENDSPLPYRGMDVLVTSRDRQAWAALDGMAAEHGPMCEAPPATHTLVPMPYEQAVFVCRDHLMTALKADGYGLLYVTPPQMVDFSAGEAVISFDISTFRSSPDRDWWDVWITPWDDNLPAPTERWLPDLQGEPKRSIQVGQVPESNLVARVSRNGTVEKLVDRWAAPFPTGVVPSATERQTIEIRITKDRLTWGYPKYSYWFNADPAGAPISPPLDFTRAVVQFGHHSYNPEKSSKPAFDGTPPRAGTWHWDNLAISPAVPFTIIPMTTRAVFEQAVGTPYKLEFAGAAPDGARLRVNALGEGMQVSVDGGATWAPLARQAQVNAAMDHFSGYWHPVPAGTQSVLVKSTRAGWWGLGGVNYAALWSQVTELTPPTGPTPVPTTPPTPEPTATNTPGPTMTPIPPPPTSTPAPPTAIPGPTDTPDVPATSTSVPPTPTPTPICYPAYFEGDDPDVKRDPMPRACP